MKFIIFIASRLRRGQFPRLSDFQHSHHFDAYIYRGQVMDVAQFNAACEIVFSEHYRAQGYTFRPLALDEAAVAKWDEHLKAQEAQAKAIADARAKAEAAKVAASSPAKEEEDEPTLNFTLEDDEVFMDGVKVAKINDDGSLRAAHGYADLKPQVEAWLSENSN